MCKFGKSLRIQFLIITGYGAVARVQFQWASAMNLPTKWAYNPLFADKLAKFGDEILVMAKTGLFLKCTVVSLLGGVPLSCSHPVGENFMPVQEI